ncbi:hypothetical protein PbJCM13498_32340 [Prolixibacter bellariivorans]|uniref:DUF4249 domain-containing protein n=1 Tax=Prolixibacter bellariivorans TaxID=314319 RepID=A0A5M4B3B2_9BACT|nr:DUF4249 domain-containing protein [Prolixibacter bellariivorans]GET34371.1 hypothetical protein PbJCM13498_32340 [Prolixibacter bellariivorans]
MRVNKKYILLLAISLIGAIAFQQCVEPFTPEIKKYSNLLVIDGTLTDELGKQVITVSRTSSYNDDEYIAENGCTITVMDDQGNIYPYVGKGNGKYEAEFYRGDLEYGRAYMLRVISNDGEVFESNYETLMPAPRIDSVTAVYGSKVTVELPDGLNGYQFFVNASDPSGNTRYYRWSMEETWEYRAPYRVSYMWNGTLHDFSFADDRSRCWKTAEIPGIYTGTTRNFSKNVLRNIKLNYVSTLTERLKWRYSLLVREYALSVEAYEFWSGLEEQTQETGGLYESQPYMVKGNITCMSNPNEAVLGFFSASGVTKKRIFVDPPPEDVNDLECPGDTISIFNPLLSYPESSYPVYLFEEKGSGIMVTAERRCFDCLERDGTNIEPDFWKD